MALPQQPSEHKTNELTPQLKLLGALALRLQLQAGSKYLVFAPDLELDNIRGVRIHEASQGSVDGYAIEVWTEREALAKMEMAKTPPTS